MDSTLRPMSTSQVLDRTFFLYRKHFVLFAGISAILPALLVLLQIGFAAMGFSFQNPEVSKTPEKFIVLMLGYFFCVMVVYVIGHAIATGATVWAVSRLHLGQPASIAESYRRVLARFWTVLAIVLLVFFCVYGLASVGGGIAGMVGGIIVAGVAAASGGGAGSLVFTVIAVIIGVAIFAAGLFLGFYFYLRWCLAVPASLVEGSGVMASLGRSFSLAKGSLGRLALIYLLTWVLSTGLGLAFGVPGMIAAAAMPKKLFLLTLGIQQLGAFIAGVLTGPIAPIALSLVYYDQRVRKEAFDLQLMMQALEQTAPPPAVAAAPLG